MLKNHYQQIFSPGSIGTLHLKNRLVVPAMATMYANPDGTASDRLIAYHERKAKGGWGLIITEDYRIGETTGGFLNLPGIWSDETDPKSLLVLVKTVHSQGAKIAVPNLSCRPAGTICSNR